MVLVWRIMGNSPNCSPAKLSYYTVSSFHHQWIQVKVSQKCMFTLIFMYKRSYQRNQKYHIVIILMPVTKVSAYIYINDLTLDTKDAINKQSE